MSPQNISQFLMFYSSLKGVHCKQLFCTFLYKHPFVVKYLTTLRRKNGLELQHVHNRITATFQVSHSAGCRTGETRFLRYKYNRGFLFTPCGFLDYFVINVKAFKMYRSTDTWEILLLLCGKWREELQTHRCKYKRKL